MQKKKGLVHSSDQARDRFSQLSEFLERIAKAGNTSNPDHFFRAGKIDERIKLNDLGNLFLTVAMGFEKDEFIPCIGGPLAPEFVPQSEDYYPWALYIVPTNTEDLMEVFHKRAIQYLHSDSAGKKNYVVITNLRSFIVADLKHYLSDYDVSFADLYDALTNRSETKESRRAKENWTRFLSDFGPESSSEKKKKRRSDVISYVEPKESHLGYVKRFGNMPSFEHPIGWDGKNFQETFRTKDLPFLTTEEFDWNGQTKKMENRLVWGDNLAVMRSLPDECIDLIYIDPPFFSGHNYNLIFGDDDEVRTFSDIWDGGLPTYLAWLNARLWEMRRLLKPSGSIVVHLDWHAVHYVKCELDKIFQYENFKNHLIWSYSGPVTGKIGHLPRKHDDLLWYVKSEDYYLDKDAVRIPYDEKTVERFKHNGPGGFMRPKGTVSLNEAGKLPTSVWTDIPYLNAGLERIGYPTQKPERLAERVIKMLSPRDGVVADFFSGGGTTVTVAEKLGRRWLGCDISRIAVSVIRDRLAAVYESDVGVTRGQEKAKFGFSVQNHGAYDKNQVRNLDEVQYRSFVLSCYEASTPGKGDYIHGFKGQKAVHVAPAKGKATVDLIEEFHTELSRLKMRSGVILTWSWDKEAEKYIEELRRGVNGPDIQLVQVKLVNIDSHEFKGDNVRFLNNPAAVIRCKHAGGTKYIFDGTASQGRNDVDIHYFQWDFNFQGRFRPTTRPNFKDEDGDKNSLNDTRRVEYQFPKPGRYKIALRIIDKSGAEAQETIDLHVEDARKAA